MTKKSTSFQISIYSLLFFSILISSCSEGVESSGIDPAEIKLFELVTAEQSGIHFNNELTENKTFNHILYDVFFDGAGVATGDINNDGLEDFYIAGNVVPDKLYLNKGNLEFEDITEKAKINFDGKWSTGVTMADVNNDGWIDIYVCKYLLDDPVMRENSFYINNGDLTFTEKAKEYGIADNGYSTVANFFDYNKDGHLDLYVGNQPHVKRHQKTAEAYQKDFRFTDNLYRNNGDGTFSNATQAAGITNYNFTLACTVSDINNDGWLDIYIACDFEEPDVYYQNNGDGTFTNVINEKLKHLSTFSMGVDIADINNDGWMDIYVADMVAADNKRLKANMSGMNPEKFWNLAKIGYHYQYMFNVLQLNNGNGTFSEIAQMSGVSTTDWSWATLFADYDNDGYKDLIVTNGLVKDIKNNDYRNRRKILMDSLAAEMKAKGIKPKIDAFELTKLAPSVKLTNYIFHNNGDLTFKDRSISWGFEDPSWSHGAAYADFDNDGDLDIIMNNMNDKAFLYKNSASDLKLNNYLRVNVESDGLNKNSIGAKAWIYYGDQMQVSEVSPVRGYFSKNEKVLHFGVGEAKVIDKIVVVWPDGSELIKENVKVNRVLNVNHKDAKKVSNPSFNLTQKSNPLLKKFPGQALGVYFYHYENDFEDFDREILLPYRMSRLGPALATGDVNGDGLDDFYIGGPSGQYGVIYHQNNSDTFALASSDPWSADKQSEDTGALFFDCDNDGDQDLYIVSGGNDFDPGSKELQDRLYLNDGTGKFSKTIKALPAMLTSGSKVRAQDYDNDGDLDLFVGGRQVPGQYGYSARSYLLNNDKGKFTDVTEEIAPALVEPGMVTDAVWTDYDNDKDLDLIVVGEWMPISIFRNDGGKFSNATEQMNLGKSHGWWNNIVAADMDNDGDEDYIIGNLGLNLKYKASEEQPFRLYVKDFDENGTHDVYLAYYDSDGISYPVRGRQCSSQQLPYIKKEFKTYGEFSVAPVEQVLGSRLEGAEIKEANIFESVYLENTGDGFKIKNLPNEAQISPIYGIVVYDWNKDGHKDILTGGNYYEREVETTRSDAGIGNILLGNGKGNFTAMKNFETGLKSDLDVRDIQMVLNKDNEPVIIVANNNYFLEFYKTL